MHIKLFRSFTWILLLFVNLQFSFANNIGNEIPLSIGPPFTFSAESLIVDPDSTVCMDFTCESFENVVAFQFGVEYDQTVLSFLNASSTVLSPTEFFAEQPATAEPIVTLAWASLSATPLSVSDNTTIFTLCFQAIGPPNSCSSINFSPPASGSDITIAANGIEYGEDDFIFNNGQICIGDEVIENLTLEATPFDAHQDGSILGSIYLEIDGGLKPYTISVTECNAGFMAYGPIVVNDQSLTISNLSQGIYQVDVFDSSVPQLSVNQKASIGTCSLPLLVGFNTTPISCPGESDATIECMAEQSSPIPINSYTWSNGIETFTGNPIQNVAAGNYNVTISDAIGCSIMANVTIENPPAFEFNFAMNNYENPTCNGDANGFIHVFVNGGTAPYTYSLSDGSEIVGENELLLENLNSGNYKISVEDNNGCTLDEIGFTLVNPGIIVSTIEYVVCEGESQEGYSQEGTYTDILQSSLGCDSIRTLILNVQNDSTILNIVICEGDEYEGNTESGSYTTILTSSIGCDSVVVVNLEVLPVDDETIQVNICEGEEYEGYTMSGTYEDSYINQSGCDSTIILELTVNLNVTFSLTDTICEGQAYEGYTMTGIYEDTFEASNGCDSIRTLNLMVLPITDPFCIMDNTSSLLAYEGFDLFPNPALDFIEIRDEKGDLDQFQVLTSDGLIIRQEAFKHSYTLNLEDLPQGIYFIKGFHTSGLITRKFVKF